MEKEYYTPQEAADILDVSLQTIRRLIKNGRLRSLNIAVSKKPNYRIPKSAIESIKSQSNE